MSYNITNVSQRIFRRRFTEVPMLTFIFGPKVAEIICFLSNSLMLGLILTVYPRVIPAVLAMLFTLGIINSFRNLNKT